MPHLISLLLLALAGCGAAEPAAQAPPPPSPAAIVAAQGDAVIGRAFRERKSNVQVEGEGAVERVLPDDRSGSRHQKFILRLRSGQSLLIAHNIDLAPRIPTHKAGDRVSFYGEYEWSSKGGVIHWTHRDPRGRHAAGWLKHGGRTYQ